MMKLLAPNVIFATAFESLGTAKLELIMTKEIQESPYSVAQLLSVVLYAELGLKDRLQLIQKMLDKPNASRFLIEVLFFKLMSLYLFRKLTSHEDDAIKPMLGEVFARLSNAKDERTTKLIKGRMMANLDKRKLMREAAK